MASTKKINASISSLSSEKIYALLDDIDSDYEEEIDNLMNNSDTEFVDRTAIENLEKDIPEAMTHEKDDSNVRNFILTAKPVRIAKPDSESIDDSDVLLGNLVAKKMLLGNGIHILKSQD